MSAQTPGDLECTVCRNTSSPHGVPPGAQAPGQAPAFVDARCSDSTCHARGAYRMIGYCINCGLEPVLGLFTVGHERRNGVLGADCPVCGTRNLNWKRLATPDEIPAEFEAQR